MIKIGNCRILFGMLTELFWKVMSSVLLRVCCTEAVRPFFFGTQTVFDISKERELPPVRLRKSTLWRCDMRIVLNMKSGSFDLLRASHQAGIIRLSV